MLVMTTSVDSRPWYRHGWVWFLIAIPATSIVLGMILLWLSVTHSDSLVADDYYREGRAINQRLEKDQLAQDLGIRLSAAILPQANGRQRIDVRFSANEGVTPPTLLRARLSHPTLNEQDILITLIETSEKGLYRTEVPEITTGRWYVMIENESSEWRVRATWTVE
jgi:hypothetical protein